MDTITIWADLSNSVMHGQSPASTIARSVIATIDIAKIRKDSENAIRNDVNLRSNPQLNSADLRAQLNDVSNIGTNFVDPKIEPENAFSIGSAPVFISNAKIAVMGIKQEKATPEQWVTVRTKAFKNWFGDWESNAEIEAMRRRVVSWMSEENLEWARGKTRGEIIEHFGNIPEPIAYIPMKYLGYLGQEVTNNRVYSGMGYFIDHAVNHHPKIGAEKYIRIQDVLGNPDEVKAIKDNGNDSIVFIKEIDRFNAVVIEIEQNEDGQIVWHKSFYDQRKKPYANKGVQLYSKSLEGGVSSIIHTEDSVHDSSLSVLNDTTNIQRNFVNPSDSSKIVDANGEPEVLHHDGDNDAHLQSIAAIPQMVERGIYITSEEVSNDASEKLKNAKEVQYYVCGLNIGDVAYTVKFVVAEYENGDRYYDHSLTQI